MIKAVLFDFDLTLVDSEQALECALLEFEKAHGLSGKKLTTDEKWGNTLKGFLTRLAELNGNPIRIEELEKKWEACITKTYKECEIREREYLKRLSERGILLGIISGCGAKRIRKVLGTEKNKGLTFEIVFGGEKGIKKPELIREALTKLEVKPEEAIYVGDHPKDIVASKEAGVIPVSITTGFYSKSQLEEYKPAQIIDMLEELEPMLK
ncbi:MAG: HAD family hydrolase [Candidatus Aenigmarchaeota archaeon]|nr:HAD family hydrolase [Candidatus Aenigmarchaeota archaeon]